MERLDKKIYHESLPKKRMSAGLLIFDEAGNLLVVEPTYKSTWEIPGGTVEKDESPRTAAVREAVEEIGLYCEPLRLLGVDFSGDSAKRSESLHFIFQGPVLTAEQISEIHLKKKEIRSYRLLPVEEATRLLNKKLRRRVRHCVKVIGKKRTLYMEEQQPF